MTTPLRKIGAASYTTVLEVLEWAIAVNGGNSTPTFHYRTVDSRMTPHSCWCIAHIDEDTPLQIIMIGAQRAILKGRDWEIDLFLCFVTYPKVSHEVIQSPPVAPDMIWAYDPPPHFFRGAWCIISPETKVTNPDGWNRDAVLWQLKGGMASEPFLSHSLTES